MQASCSAVCPGELWEAGRCDGCSVRPSAAGQGEPDSPSCSLHSTPVLSPACGRAQADVRRISFVQTKAVLAEGCCIYGSGGG